MPRRKGKSQRRIKDWERRYREAEPDTLHADSTQTLQPLRVKLPSSRIQANLDEPSADQIQPTEEAMAMVTGLFPGGAVVRLGDDDLLCQLAGTFRPPKGSSALAVGDEVAVALTRHTDRDETEASFSWWAGWVTMADYADEQGQPRSWHVEPPSCTLGLKGLKIQGSSATVPKVPL